MFDFGFSEILVILVLALIVLGPERLPGVVRRVGRWVGRARAMARQFQDQLEEELDFDERRRTAPAEPYTPDPAAQPETAQEAFAAAPATESATPVETPGPAAAAASTEPVDSPPRTAPPEPATDLPPASAHVHEPRG